MEVFKFSTKQQAKTYTFFTVLSVVISIYIFSSLDNLSISSSVAYLIVAILSSVSIIVSVKKAGKTFEEIIIYDKKIEFFFANKMKKKFETKINKVTLKESPNKIEVIDEETGKLIGIAFKNRIKEIEIKKFKEYFKQT